MDYDEWADLPAFILEIAMKSCFALLVALLAGINLAFAAVNINSASVEELDAVKGITPAKAKAIVDYRSNNGPFKSLDELKGVKGFGEKSVAKLKDELVIGEAAPAKAAKK
jgi:competence protein ComEA